MNTLLPWFVAVECQREKPQEGKGSTEESTDKGLTRGTLAVHVTYKSLNIYLHNSNV